MPRCDAPGSRASSARRAARDQLRAAANLTELRDGKRFIVEQPPVIQHVEIPGGPDALRRVFEDYRATMAESRREFLERYRFADFALKVVGVGSVGTRCFVMILEGRDENDPLILQAKEATASVLEGPFEASAFANHGERVVVGQRLMQATPDIFLGWTRSRAGRDFYLRQLWDMKGSVDTSTLRTRGPRLLRQASAPGRWHGPTPAAVTPWPSPRTSAPPTRSTAPSPTSPRAYADQNERDHRAYRAAIEAGQVSTTT